MTPPAPTPTGSIHNKVLSPTSNVRRTCRMLMNDPPLPEFGGNGTRNVTINNDKLQHLCQRIMIAASSSSSKDDDQSSQLTQWDEWGWHYTAQSYKRNQWKCRQEYLSLMKKERVSLYVLALDAINFCFWPSSSPIEYEHVAMALKRAAETDDDISGTTTSPTTKETASFPPTTTSSSSSTIIAEDTYPLSPTNLTKLTPSTLPTLLHLPPNLFNLPERCRLLNELGHALLSFHDGSATTLLAKANHSAETLTQILIATFPGFRDECIDRRGRQLFFYKRAQIAVADLHAALRLRWGDIGSLTTFADYRVPQLLRHEGVLVYGRELAMMVDEGREMRAGSEEEVYIRAATVVAVDEIVGVVNDGRRKEGLLLEGGSRDVTAVEVDWYLWQLGEDMVRTGDGEIGVHHKVRTIFY